MTLFAEHVVQNPELYLYTARYGFGILKNKWSIISNLIFNVMKNKTH